MNFELSEDFEVKKLCMASVLCFLFTVLIDVIELAGVMMMVTPKVFKIFCV